MSTQNLSAADSSDRSISLAALVLRLGLGVVLLAHGLFKLGNLAGVGDYFASLGLPPELVYPVIAIELVAGLLLIAGYQTRWAALASIPVLLGATWAHAGNGWLFSGTGGGWEFPLLLIVLAIVQSLVGDGAYSVLQLRKLPGRSQSAAA